MKKTNMKKKAAQCQRCGSSVIVKNGSNANGKEAFNMSSNGKIFIKADEMWTFIGDKENDAFDREERHGIVSKVRGKSKSYRKAQFDIQTKIVRT